MIICFRYRLLPRKSQHRALEAILESQRQLYNAALEERIGAYRKAGLSITCFDQGRGLTEWRKSDAEARELPVNLRLIEVNPRDTSQECSGCGMLVPKALGERRHDCPHCGLSTDRDLNSARNVLNRAGVGPGLRNVAGGCGMRAGENLVSDRWTRQESATPN